MGLRHHRFGTPRWGEGRGGIGNQAVAADLVTGKGVLVHQHHVQVSARQLDGRGAARRACTDDQDIAVGGQVGAALLHGADCASCATRHPPPATRLGAPSARAELARLASSDPWL